MKKTKKTRKPTRLDILEANVHELQSELYIRTDERLDGIEKELHLVTARLETVFEGLGGAVWRTQQGHLRFLAVLSTEHLNNIIKWPSASEGIRQKCRAELQRREIDAQHRHAEKPFEVRVDTGDIERQLIQASLSTSRKAALARAQEVVRLLGG